MPCDHFRAVLYYAESILNPRAFPAFECDIKIILQKGNVKLCITKNKMTTFLGEMARKDAIGVFYLDTRAASPFGLGNSSIIT